MSDAIREVLIRYKVEVDRGASATAMKSLADSAKKLQAEAAKGSKDTEREEARKWKSIESMDRRAFAARSKLIKEHQTEEARGAKDTERLAERVAKTQEQADRRQFAARMQTIKARQAAEQSAARGAEQAANRAAKIQEQLDRRQFAAGMKTIKDREAAEGRAARESEQAVNRAARAQETAAGRGRHANARAIEGFRMMTTGLGQAVRALGYLAASDEKSAEAMAKVVLVVEGTIAGLHTLTSVGFGAVRMWQAYNAASALAGAAGALGGAGRLAGGAAAGGLGRLVMGGGIAALGVPIAAGAAAIGGAALAGRSIGEAIGGNQPGGYNQWMGGLQFGMLRRMERMTGGDMYGDVSVEKAGKRLPEYQRRSAFNRARADIAAEKELALAKVQSERSEQLRQLRPDYMARGVEQYGRAETTLGAARAEALKEQQARLLGQPQYVRPLSGEMMQRGQAEQARAMESVNRAQALAMQDRKADEARLGGAVGRVAALQESGGGQEQVNKALEYEHGLRQKLAEAMKHEGDISRQSAQLKLESGRNILQSLTAQRDMLREIAAQARGEQRGAGIRYAELSVKERLNVDESKRAFDKGKKLNPEQRQLMREYGGRALGRRFDEESLRNAPDWIKLANDEEATGFERESKRIDANVKARYDINVQIEGQLEALGDQVARTVGQQVEAYFNRAAQMVQQAAKRAANEAARKIREETPQIAGVLRE